MKMNKLLDRLEKICLAIMTMAILFLVTTPTLQAKEILFRYSVHGSKTALFTKFYDFMMDEIEKRTKGQIKFERYYSSSLVPMDAQLDGLGTGVADMLILSDFNFAAKLPLSNVAELPLTSQNEWSAMKAYQELQQLSELQEESKKFNVKFLYPSVLTQYYILSKKPVKSISDLKGMKIRASGFHPKILNTFGVTAVTVPIVDTYDALQKGTIDATTTNPETVVAFRFQEVAKYYYRLPLGQQLLSVRINLDAWNKLPADIRKIMEDAVDTHIDNYMRLYVIPGAKDAAQKLKEYGVQEFQASADDQAKIVAVAKEVIWDKYVKEKEAGGVPAGKVLDAWFKLLAKYQALNPYN